MCSPTSESLLRARLDPDVTTHLIHLYGEEARRVAAYGDRAGGALDRLDPRGPDIWAQVDFARDEESALTVDDVVARRTTLAVRVWLQDLSLRRFANGSGVATEPRLNHAERVSLAPCSSRRRY